MVSILWFTLCLTGLVTQLANTINDDAEWKIDKVNSLSEAQQIALNPLQNGAGERNALVISGKNDRNQNSSYISNTTVVPSKTLPSDERILKRSKRFLAFPEGSSFSVAVCFTVGIVGNPRFNYMAFGLNWGVSYDLPNITWVLNHLHGFSYHSTGEGVVYRRRSRRTIYKEVENGLDYMGYNGRDCILRALCESRVYFQRTKMSMVGEMLRAIFSLPKQRIFTRELHENSDILEYDRAYRNKRSVADCILEYPCSFSLLELAFGRYSEPPADYIREHL